MNAAALPAQAGRIALIATLALFGANTTIAADQGSGAASIEQRLEQLEAGYEQLKRENEALRRLLEQQRAAQAPTTAPAPADSPAATPAGSADAAVAAATPRKDAPPPVDTSGKASSVKISGYIMGQAEAGDAGDARFAGTNDRLYIRRARIAVSGELPHDFDFKIEGEFGTGTLSERTGIDARANEIYINWHRYDAANLRFGQLKPAFGAEQLMSDMKLDTIERTLANDRITSGRQPGIGLYGTVLDSRLGYMLTVGNGTGSNASGNDNDSFLKAARLYGTLFDADHTGKLLLGVSAMRSEDDGSSFAGPDFDSTPGGTLDNLFYGERRGWAVDASWSRGPLELSGELLRMEFEPRNALPAASIDSEGWHVMARYALLPGRMHAVIRREVYDPNVDVSGDATRNWVAGLDYALKGDDIRFMINYLFGDAPGLPDDSGRALARIQVAY